MSRIALEGNVSGTGVFTLASPNGSTDRTLDLPDASGVIDRLNRAGNVLQVVQGTRIGVFATTSTSYVSTGLTASITPSSTSSKVLVLIHTNVDSSASNRNAFITLVRNGSNLGGAPEGFGAHQCSSGGARATGSISYLDSPASTSSVTYNLAARSSDGGTIEVPPWSGMVQSIILMEIAA